MGGPWGSCRAIRRATTARARRFRWRGARPVPLRPCAARRAGLRAARDRRAASRAWRFARTGGPKTVRDRLHLGTTVRATGHHGTPRSPGTTIRSDARSLRLSGERMSTGRRLSISAQWSQPRRNVPRVGTGTVASNRNPARERRGSRIRPSSRPRHAAPRSGPRNTRWSRRPMRAVRARGRPAEATPR